MISQYRVCLASILLLCSISTAQAGFLEMPDTEEVPDLERETLLKDLDVPNVRERDPDPQAGPRLNITEFRIQGVVEYPELGITREKLNKLVEDIRFDLMDEGELLDTGYTLEEISQVSDLVAAIEEETGDQHVGPLEVQRLVFLIREQRRKRGVTLGMIETVADTITRYYRERGFILAKAYIPEQRVRDGVVTLTLLLGELGEVNVQKNKVYKDKTIQRIFKGVMEKPVTSKNIEERIYYVNDLPGLAAQGYFEPGTQVGDTRLNINVLNEQRFASNIRIDNHGSESTGELRLYVDGVWNNPLGIGDELHLAILNTFDPDNSTFGSFRYSLPLFHPRLKMKMGFSRNDFVPSELENTSGDSATDSSSDVLDVDVSFQLSRSRERNTSISVRFADIASTTTITETFENQEFSHNVELSYSFDVLIQKSAMLHQGTLTLVGSEFGEENSSVSDESLGFLRFDYSVLKFIELPYFKNKARWLTRAAGQYTGESLSSINQFGVTGPSRARSFGVADYFADDGFYVGTDLIFQAPKFLDFKLAGESFSKVVQPFIFSDVAYGTVYAKTDQEKTAIGNVQSRATLVNVGVGMTFTYKGKLRSNLTYATPIVFDPDIQEGQGVTPSTFAIFNADGPRFFMDLQYSF